MELQPHVLYAHVQCDGFVRRYYDLQCSPKYRQKPIMCAVQTVKEGILAVRMLSCTHRAELSRQNMHSVTGLTCMQS